MACSRHARGFHQRSGGATSRRNALCVCAGDLLRALYHSSEALRLASAAMQGKAGTAPDFLLHLRPVDVALLYL